MSKHMSDVRSAVGKVRGGVRVLHHKNTADCPIVRVPVPQQVVLPMQMHIGRVAGGHDRVRRRNAFV